MKQISEFLIGETSKALYNSENAILNAYIRYTQKYVNLLSTKHLSF